MPCYIVYCIYVRNGMTRYQYTITPREVDAKDPGNRLVGTYPDVETAFAAAIKKGIGLVYLFQPTDFPTKILHPEDLKGLEWDEKAYEWRKRAA
jgi:hypothetical protein